MTPSATEGPGTTNKLGILGGFQRSVAAHPDRPALRVAGEEFTYSELHRRALALADTLERHDPDPTRWRTAVLAHRSPNAYAGVLASLYRGHAYVPLNPRFPIRRTAEMLERSGARSVVVDAMGERVLDAVLDAHREQLLVVLPHRSDVSDLASDFPRTASLGAASTSVRTSPSWTPPPGHRGPRPTCCLLRAAPADRRG